MKVSVEDVTVIGSTGFVGGSLVNKLVKNKSYIIHLLSRKHSNIGYIANNVHKIHVGDLLEISTIEPAVNNESTVINLSYSSSAGEDENIKAIKNLVDVCIEKKVKKFIHLSTATVVGKTNSSIVDEDTKCDPFTEYEKCKYKIENIILDRLNKLSDPIILRPTAIFGPDGENLMKLANSLIHGNPFFNSAKSYIFGNRRLNLVCLDNVIESIIFFLNTKKNSKHKIFIISDDDNPINNFYNVEKLLLKKFGLKSWRLGNRHLHPDCLSQLLKIKGLSNTNPYRRYSSKRLMQFGYQKAISLEEGIDKFANWYKDKYISCAT